MRGIYHNEIIIEDCDEVKCFQALKKLFLESMFFKQKNNFGSRGIGLQYHQSFTR